MLHFMTCALVHDDGGAILPVLSRQTPGKKNAQFYFFGGFCHVVLAIPRQ